MIVIGLDPGYKDSAFVTFNGTSVVSHFTEPNEKVLEWAHDGPRPADFILVVEQISMGGMIAGAEIFETCFWSGRFIEAWAPHRWARMKRKDVKLHLCGRVHAKDANVRAALIERFGPEMEKAVGNKKNPGPLYGIKAHEWAALAVAVAWYDQNGHKDPIRPGVDAQF